MQKNILDYLTIKSTLNELIKVGETEITDNLLDIINYNELPKPDKHNRKKDITSSYFEINLSSEIIEKIIDLFSELEVESLTENGESTNSTNHYVELLDKWQKIQNEEN
ncbi:hypothetical protein NTJ12_002427 [Flavobacterium psychrophilum]|nr:hypothetical protein [Flavobacterium psychrophilum]